MNITTIIDGDSLNMVFSNSMNKIRIKKNKKIQIIDCVPISSNSYSLIINGKTYYLTITPKAGGYEVTVNNHTHFVEIKDKLDLLLEKYGMKSDTSNSSGEIHAQIPGLVSRICVESGDSVDQGETLCILEAMKMENEITSPKSGTIKKIFITSGSNVNKGDILMEISN